MKAQELRIGNLLSYDGTAVQVSNIGYNGFETTKDGVLYGSCNLESYDPIPLTKQWLLDFRFINSQIGLFEKKVLSRGSINIHTNRRDIKFVELGTTGHSLFGVVDVKFVHQLQNLYFALTGQELQL